MSDVSVDDLRDSSRFVLLEKLPQQELMPFVRRYIGRNSAVTAFYLLFLVVTLTWFLYEAYRSTFRAFALCAVIALVVNTIVVAPLHELIHAGFYKLWGAPRVDYHISFKKFVAYVTADRFVLGGPGFFAVAVAPFVLLNGAILLAAAVSTSDPNNYRLSLAGLLFWHTTGCVGDFALINFFWRLRKISVFTFDEASTGLTYFYARIPRESSAG